MDFRTLLDKIEEAYLNGLPFVAYRKPNATSVNALFQNDTELHFLKNYNEKGFVFAPFDDREDSILVSTKDSKMYTILLPSQDIPLDEKFSKLDDRSTKENHIDLVKKGISFIKNGNAKKIVLSRKEEVEIKNFSIAKFFEKLLYNYTNAFAYIWFHPAIGLWLGATPETLIMVDAKEFKTMSLAGTQTFKEGSITKWHKKEIEEQQIVTDYIVDNLKTSVKDLKISDPYTVKAGNLVHLKTDIQGSLIDASNLKSVLSILHPTPAVCGMPKEVSKQFILENENYKREFYTGFLGELNIENCSNFFVNLRCMQVNNDTASLFVGGGITADSIAENEWQETIEKSKVMKKVL